MEHTPLISTVGIISLLLVLWKLRTIAGITPSLTACALRWKESVNLEESLGLVRERDITYFILIPPSLLLCSRFNILGFDFAADMGPDLRLAFYAGVAAAYALIRFIPQKLMGHGHCSPRLYAAFLHSFRNFASVAAILCLTAAGICDLLHIVPELLTAQICGGIAAGVYILYIIRKGQILGSINGAVTTFLYLCGLELLPAGLLAAAAVLL